MGKTLFRSNIITILAHISAWGAFFSIPLLIKRSAGLYPPLPIKPVSTEGVMALVVLMIFIFYINFSILVPRLLNRFGVRYYGVSVLLLCTLGLFISYLIKTFFMTSDDHPPFYITIFPITLIITMGLSIRLLIDKTQSEHELKERENETLKSELAFLRSQISPHFLFNVMNNVVSLSRLKPHLVEPTLIQLSQLMRYMLYGSDEKKVTIQNEINYLQSYIDLQNLRFGDSIKVFFEKNVKNTEGSLEPMLLIPFVENAFKHGIGLVKNPEIHIQFLFENGVLLFEVKNKYDALERATNKDTVSGIGLKNVSRRLELLYPNQHELAVGKDGEWFVVKLKIQLKNSQTQIAQISTN